MEKTVIIVPGLFGGVARKYYAPLARILGEEEFYVFKAGEDWNPTEIANNIRRIKGHKIVVCLSIGALVGNMVARDEDTEVYYICPYLGASFINRTKKAYAYRLRHFFKGLSTVLMVLSWPFKKHRWYPLFGGTRPDGWFLSVYAICEQLKFAFSKAPCEPNSVDGVIFSYGDNVVEPAWARFLSENVVVAWTDERNGKGPSHVNLRAEGEKFGSSAVGKHPEKLSEDAKAYLTAFAKMIAQRSH